MVVETVLFNLQPDIFVFVQDQARAVNGSEPANLLQNVPAVSIPVTQETAVSSCSLDKIT